MKRYKELVIIFLFSLTPFLWLHGGQIVFGHDSGVRLNYVENLKSYLYAWDPTANFGHNWSLYTGFLVSQFPETFFAWVFGSLSRGQPFGFWFWFFEIGLSLWVFLRYFFRDEKFLPIRIIGSILFMYNFYILNGWSIVERAKFSLYIALPLMIVIFFKTARKEWSLLKGAIMFGLLFFFFNGGGSIPLYGGMLVTFAILVVYFLRINPVRIIGFSALCGVFFFLFNAYWILPQVRLAASSYAGALNTLGGVDGLIAWEKEISKHASVINILRLRGFPDWYDNPDHAYARIYFGSKLLDVMSYIPIVLIAIGLLRFGLRSATKKQKQVLVFLLFLATVGIFFTGGSHPPLGIIYQYLMRYIPGFAIFRSSLYKFAPAVYLAIIVFFGYYISEFLSRRKLSETARFCFVVAIAAGIALYHFPYFTGNFFVFKGGFSTRLKVPDYVTEMVGAVQSRTTLQDRILLVPPLDVGFISNPIDTYTWGFYGLDVLPRVAISRSFLANDSSDDTVTRLLYKTIAEGDSETFLRLAAKAGVTHMLWRGDVRVSQGIQKNMPVAAWEEKISVFSPLRLEYEAGLWRLYRINKPSPSMVSATTNISFINDTTVDDAYIVGSNLSADSDVLLRVSEDKEAIVLPKDRFIQAECFLCKINEYSKLVEAIKLPAFRKSPLSFLRHQKIIEDGSPSEIDARLSAASTALSERNMTDYENQMHSVVEILNTLTGREKDYYSNRVMAYLDGFAKYTDQGDFRREVLPLTWMAEGMQYRFGVTVPKEGEYFIWLHTTDIYNQSITLDGKTYRLGEKITLASGYHRIVLTVKSIENTSDAIASPVFLRETNPSGVNARPPRVSFSQINPSRLDVTVSDATAPYALVLNQQFDPSWSLSVDGTRQDYSHQMANGYANAWIVPKTGSYMLSLYYAPQQQEYLGMIISAFSIVCSCIYLVVKRI